MPTSSDIHRHTDANSRPIKFNPLAAASEVLPRRNRLSFAIESRWREWEPTLRIVDGLSGFILDAAKEVHRSRYLVLAAQGIQGRTATRTSIDDPRLTEAEFQSRLSDYLTKRARLKARSKETRECLPNTN